jgi:hypothetical protein
LPLKISIGEVKSSEIDLRLKYAGLENLLFLDEPVIDVTNKVFERKQVLKPSASLPIISACGSIETPAVATKENPSEENKPVDIEDRMSVMQIEPKENVISEKDTTYHSQAEVYLLVKQYW